VRRPIPFARRRAAHLVHTRLGHPEETVIEIDGGIEIKIENGTAPQRKFNLIATDAALYVYPIVAPDRVRRYTYWQLRKVYAEPWRRVDCMGFFVFADRRFWSVLRSRGRLPNYVKEAAQAHPNTPPAGGQSPGPPSGDRFPRRPHPSSPADAIALADPT
jgi:hypothetical protein